jgi:CHAD domain-containing protein
MIAAFESTIRSAIRSAGLVRSDHVRAVHEFRKSIRRSRALIRMMRPVLSRRSRRQIDVALKSAHRATSGQRDNDVLMAALELANLAHTPLAASLTTKTAMTRSEINRVEKTLRWGIRTIAGLPQRLAEALPEKVKKKQLYAGIANSYSSARNDYRRTRTVADPTHIHAWRKRNKDVMYQMEFLSALGSQRAAKARKQHAKLSGQLGELTDLHLLRDYIENVEQPAAQRIRVMETFNRQLADRLGRSLALGSKLYGRSPGKFADRLRP